MWECKAECRSRRRFRRVDPRAFDQQAPSSKGPSDPTATVLLPRLTPGRPQLRPRLQGQRQAYRVRLDQPLRPHHRRGRSLPSSKRTRVRMHHVPRFTRVATIRFFRSRSVQSGGSSFYSFLEFGRTWTGRYVAPRTLGLVTELHRATRALRSAVGLTRTCFSRTQNKSRCQTPSHRQSLWRHKGINESVLVLGVSHDGPDAQNEFRSQRFIRITPAPVALTVAHRFAHVTRGRYRERQIFAVRTYRRC
ncbi:hypothetical protein SAMN04487967_3737 [Natronorubrum sediminis]|uniref:Uncharacterized protein n=1 Tax=Natronorubrum sediminis TaxID=640943 RepID=A0A1H6G529_9EURY|nr:hypothetical protein SAMN04487967_3737 [Natronorubrum sediminis]